ncbi:MAG: nucleotidyltransferase domain-containing protein [Nitrospirae bacterium]|nr:nucleotidyltransferase domain-containing protein [Nitrospirota bacterium]
MEGIIKQYILKLKELNVRVERVLLYGSYAKGQAKEDSDIDLIIVSRDFERMNIRERLEVLGIAGARIMQPIQAKGYTPQEMESKNPFLIEILEHSRVAA